jgi:hypothetical protein
LAIAAKKRELQSDAFCFSGVAVFHASSISPFTL